jgi:FtsZ-binding cell division protein ZapB
MTIQSLAKPSNAVDQEAKHEQLVQLSALALVTRVARRCWSHITLCSRMTRSTSFARHVAARADEATERAKTLDRELETLKREHDAATREEGGAQDRIDALEEERKKLKDQCHELERK